MTSSTGIKICWCEGYRRLPLKSMQARPNSLLRLALATAVNFERFARRRLKLVNSSTDIVSRNRIVVALSFAAVVATLLVAPASPAQVPTSPAETPTSPLELARQLNQAFID